MNLREEILKIDDGIFPVKLQVCMLSVSKFVRLPISNGITPESQKMGEKRKEFFRVGKRSYKFIKLSTK
jgi:hypothetical protein